MCLPNLLCFLCNAKFCYVQCSFYKVRFTLHARVLFTEIHLFLINIQGNDCIEINSLTNYKCCTLFFNSCIVKGALNYAAFFSATEYQLLQNHEYIVQLMQWNIRDLYLKCKTHAVNHSFKSFMKFYSTFKFPSTAMHGFQTDRNKPII